MARPLAYPYGSHDAHTEPIARGCGHTHCFGTDERVDANVLREHLAATA